MFSQNCIVCAQKQKEVFENLEKTLTVPAFHYYEKLVEMCFERKFSDKEIKMEIESYCLAEPKVQYKSKMKDLVDEISENQ